MKCQVCNIREGSVNHNLTVCSKCTKQSSFKMINKTTAMKNYVLTSKDLSNIRHAKGWNPNNNLSYNLYIIDDIERIAIQKYGGIEGAKKKIMEREKRKKDNKKKVSIIKHNRRVKLHKHLINVGLPGVKDDSILCRDYIEKGLACGYTMEDIARIMLEMEFYYQHTNYRQIIGDVRRHMRSQFGSLLEEEDVRESAKYKSLKAYVKANFLNHHKMVDELPLSLKDEAFRLSDRYYNKHKIKKRSDKDKELLDSLEKESNFKNKKMNDTIEEYNEVFKQIRESLKE